MSYNLDIENMIGKLTDGWPDLGKKMMFGGVCYLIKGNMAFGIWKDYLIVRTGKEPALKFLEEEGIKPFDITGRAMQGWIMVDESRWGEPGELERWLCAGRDFAMTLPERESKK